MVDRPQDLPPALPAVGMGDTLAYRRAGIQKRILARLKKGKIVPERILDLHGMTETAAQKKLLVFLDHCSHESIRCIRIIHGKGRGSRNNIPVIKNLLNNLLRDREEVLAFTSAPVNDGGTGVVYVLLDN